MPGPRAPAIPALPEIAQSRCLTKDSMKLQVENNFGWKSAKESLAAATDDLPQCQALPQAVIELLSRVSVHFNLGRVWSRNIRLVSWHCTLATSQTPGNVVPLRLLATTVSNLIFTIVLHIQIDFRWAQHAQRTFMVKIGNGWR